MPEFSDLPDISTEYDEFYKEVENSVCDSGGSVFEGSSSIPEQFKQEELSNLTSDSNLSKEAAECLRTVALVTFYGTREKNYRYIRISVNKKDQFTAKTSKSFHLK